MTPFRLRLLKGARDDLRRLEHFLIERELKSEAPDWTLSDRALAALQEGLRLPTWSPFTCRKAQLTVRGLRELVVPFGASGYIVLFQIFGDEVRVVAIRHQREQDYRH